MLIDHNGYRFAIDTMDMGDSATVSKAHDVLEDWVRSLDAEDTAQLHADLLVFGFDATTKPSALVEQALQVSEWAKQVAMGSVQQPPDQGHGIKLIAEQ